MLLTNGENNRIIKKISVPSNQKEVVAELSLPDYLPDVSRLLRTGASVGSENSYINGQSLEYDGELNFTIVYATSDGRIKSVPLKAEFDGVLSLPELSGEYGSELHTEIESVTCRLQNPRRLTVRAKLGISSDVFSEQSAVPQISGKLSAEDEGRIQKRISEVESMCRVYVKDENVPISEDIELDTQAPAIAEIISVTLTPFLSEVRASDGRLSYRGDVISEVIYLAASDDPEKLPEYSSFLRKIPISGDVEADGVTDNFVSAGYATVNGIEFRPQANAFGENRVVEIDFTYTAHLFAVCNVPVPLVTDMYSVDYQSKNDVKETESRKVLRASAFNFSADGTSSLEEKDYDSVVAETASVTVEKNETNGTKLVFCGKVDCSAILTNGAGSYIGRSFSFPFRAETEIGKCAGELECTSVPSVIGTSARIDGGELKCDVEIGVSFIAYDLKRTETVEKCAIMKDRPQKKASPASVVICYPSEGDDLWSIAKRYSTTEQSIKESNSVSGDTVAGKVLIIPSSGKKKTVF